MEPPTPEALDGAEDSRKTWAKNAISEMENGSKYHQKTWSGALQAIQQFRFFRREFIFSDVALVTKSAESFQCLNNAVTVRR